MSGYDDTATAAAASDDYGYTEGTFTLTITGTSDNSDYEADDLTDDETLEGSDSIPKGYQAIPLLEEVKTADAASAATVPHTPPPTNSPTPSHVKRKKAGSLIDLYKERDWNKEFQTITQSSETDDQKYPKLSHLAQDFIYASKLYAKVIISELFVPNEHKTIKPVTKILEGLAGGTKYICGSVLYKFALDTRGLYGNDKNAMKAGGHELKGLQSLYEFAIAFNIHTPLMTVIDYRGYRVVAMALLPIDKTSIIYGSPNAGEDVFNQDQGFADRVGQISNLLNLKEHRVGRDLVKMSVCADIEGHKSKVDGKYYMIDFQRLMPPQVRFTQPGMANADKNPHLYQLLRPELVQANPVPLSSDALTGLGRHDPDKKIHNQEVIDASKRLFESVIPKFVRHLDKTPLLHRASKQLCDVVHEHGVNLRHLGIIFKLTKRQSTLARKALLTEMASRVLKDYIKSLLRETMEKVRVPSEEPYRLKVLEYLNSCFVFNSKQYWTQTMKKMLLEKFGVEAATYCQAEDDSLLQYVDKVDLLTRCSQLSGVKLPRGAIELLQMGTSELTSRDIKLRVIVKNLNLVEHALACSLSAQALKREGTESRRIFAQAVECFSLAMSTSPLSSGTLFQWGLALHRISCKLTRLAGGRDSCAVLREAIEKLSLSISINRIYHPSRVALVLACVDLIAHEGRYWNNEVERNSETGALYDKAILSFAAALKIQQELPDDTADGVLQLLQTIDSLDETRLFVLLQIVLYSADRKTPSFKRQLSNKVPASPDVPSRRSVSIPILPFNTGPKKDIKELHALFLLRLDTRLASLVELKLNSAWLIDSKTLRYAMEHLSPKKLRDVYLRLGNNVTPDILALTTVTPRSGRFLGDAPPMSLSQIRFLDLTGTTGVFMLAPGLVSLKALNLAKTDLKDDEIRQIVSTYTNLSSLDISGCQFTSKIFDHINTFVPKLKKLRMSREINLGYTTRTYSVQIDDPPPLNFSQIQYLDLSGLQSVGKLFLSRLAEVSGATLNHLDLHNVKGINDASFLPVARRCKSLVHLDLSYTHIGNSTLRMIGSSISTLKTLLLVCCSGLEGDCGIDTIMKNNWSLCNLDFSSSFKIADSSFSWLGVDGVPFYTNLTSLSLYLNTMITDASVNFIVKQCTNLQTLNLTSLNKISNLSLIAIGKNLPQVQSIQLPFCPLLTDDGMRHLIHKCTRLKSLSIAENMQLTDRTIYDLANHCTELLSLDISKNENVTPAAIQTLLQRCPAMRELTVIGCKMISGEFLFRDIRHNCKDLEILVDRAKKLSSALWTSAEDPN